MVNFCKFGQKITSSRDKTIKAKGHSVEILKNLLPLRFYVKSILGNVEVQNLPFLQIQRLWIWIFCDFLKPEIYQINKIQST